ncbi:MAG TPA: hypothetical protein DCP38_07175 [Acidobacteria bacterium]|nr:hypothetical protein [Acidobacteriota bacterium]
MPGRHRRSPAGALAARPPRGSGHPVCGHRRLTYRVSLCTGRGRAVGIRSGGPRRHSGERPGAGRRLRRPPRSPGRWADGRGAGVERRACLSPGAHRPGGGHRRQGRRGRIGVSTRDAAAPSPLSQRNRIISGLSLAVVVVEASARSGSLITARFALDQGREVMAIPGSILGERNRGSHSLLKDGAKVVERADDILEEMGVLGGNTPVRADMPPVPPDALLACLSDGEACDLDDLTERSGLDSAALLARLLDLQLQGFVRRIEGGRFVRVNGKW